MVKREFPPDDEHIPPESESHELPTRRIERQEAEDLAASLDETRLAATAAGDQPPADSEATTQAVELPPELDTLFRRGPVAEAGPAAPDIPAPRWPYSANLEETAVNPSSQPGKVEPPPVPVPPPPPLYGGLDYRPPAEEQTPPPHRRRRTARERRDSGLYLPWWSLLILLAAVALVATVVILALSALGGQFAPGGETPVVIVITSTPTPRPTRTPGPPTPTRPPATSTLPSALLPTGGTEESAPGEGLASTSVITPPPATPELRVGVQVEVVDVGTAGLNVREGAGTGFRRLLVAREGSRFEVIGGPEESDGFTWWQIRSVDDPTDEGWAVADFLSVVP